MTEDSGDALADFERYRKEVQALRERLGSALASLEARLAPPEPEERLED